MSQEKYTVKNRHHKNHFISYLYNSGDPKDNAFRDALEEFEANVRAKTFFNKLRIKHDKDKLKYT